MRVSVDRGKCVGAGDCAELAPAVFKLDEEGIAVVISENDADDDTLLMCAEECPSQAITVYDENGEKIYPRF